MDNNEHFSQKIVFSLETSSNEDLYPFFADFLIPEFWEVHYINRESEIEKRKLAFDKTSLQGMA